MKVFYLILPDSQQINDDFLSFLSEDRKKEFNSIILKKRKIISEYSYLFCVWIISNELCIPIDCIRLKKDNNGRPYIEGYDITISLSHSLNFIVFAFGSGNIGVDVESIDKIENGIANRFFDISEKKSINKDIHKKRKTAEFWTKKESLAKCIQISLYDVLSKDIERFARLNGVSFSTFFINDKYVVTVCSTKTVDKLIKKELSELEDFFNRLM